MHGSAELTVIVRTAAASGDFFRRSRCRTRHALRHWLHAGREAVSTTDPIGENIRQHPGPHHRSPDKMSELVARTRHIVLMPITTSAATRG